MTKASDNAFPSILITEGTEPSAPAAGKQRLYIDSTTHKLKRTDSSGTDVTIEGTSTTVATDPIFDAKGDLPVGTGADTSAKLTVGANDTILMADSGQATGLKWVASQTPSTQAFGDAASEGTADTYARGDHKHAMPSAIGTDPAGFTYVVKSADQDVTNAQNTDDSELQFAVTSSKHYIVEAYILTSGDNTTGDFEARFTVSAGTMDGRGVHATIDAALAYSASSVGAVASATTGNIIVGVNAAADIGFPTVLKIWFAFRQNTSSGTFKVQFGNNSTGVGRNSRIMKGSYLRYKQTD